MWAKILNVVLAVYKAFFSGKTVNVGGNPVTLPDQKPGIPMAPGTSPFDSTPHQPGTKLR